MVLGRTKGKRLPNLWEVMLCGRLCPAVRLQEEDIFEPDFWSDKVAMVEAVVWRAQGPPLYHT